MILSVMLAPLQASAFDGAAAWEEIEAHLLERYVYLDDAGFDVPAFLEGHRAPMAAISDRGDFLFEAQRALRHFHDPHLLLSPRSARDFAILPTASDVWARPDGEVAEIVDVLRGGAAHEAGIRPGMHIRRIDGRSPGAAIVEAMGRPLASLSDEQRAFGLNTALCGYLGAERVWTVDELDDPQTLPHTYVHPRAMQAGPPFELDIVSDVAVVRVRNALGRLGAPRHFRRLLRKLPEVEGLVFDLRSTPSGGWTGIAEPLLGHFVEAKTEYQAFRWPEPGEPYEDAPLRTSWTRLRRPHIDVPVVVLVGRWTGSMGEGMALGFDHLSIPVVGAPMGDLLGSVVTLRNKESDTKLVLGVGRMFHLNGLPREDYVPAHLVQPADVAPDGSDPALAHALSILGVAPEVEPR